VLLVALWHGVVWVDDYPRERVDPNVGGPLLLTDRHGALLRAMTGHGRPGRHAWVPLGELAPAAIHAVLASEDRGFYDHRGVDWRAVGRALWLDLQAGRAKFGASTLTMQLVRMVDGQGRPRSWREKLREAVLAERLERVLGKAEILEQYLNRAYYGHGAYGLDAAAQTYFGKPAKALTTSEATLLAVIPRAPTRYDPLRRLPNALSRRRHVLELIGWTASAIAELEQQPLAVQLHRRPFEAGHFVDSVLESLPAEVRMRGGVVQTTLDLRMQRHLDERLRHHVATLREGGVHEAGAVILDSQTGAVRALAGSTDYRRSQLDITTRRRHPGSALKPFVYAAALEQGATPASLTLDIHDVPSDYRVMRLTQPERGPVRLREALGGSFNLAAVHVLESVGVDAVLAKLRQAGIGPLPGTPEDYGLRLALGAPRVRLLDVAAAYGFLVRGGRVVPPRWIQQVTWADGTTWQPRPANEQRLFSPETAWQVMDMLADAGARRPVFGEDLPLDLPFPVAAKTGTSRGFADEVAIGVTSEFTAAAWAGNFTGGSVHGLVAMQTAAPMVRQGLLLAGEGRALTLPAMPAGLRRVAVCARSGMLPGPECPHRVEEAFRDGTAPHEACNWHVGGQVRVPAVAAKWAKQHRPWWQSTPGR
jgi:penicillin-binding protein 1C